MSGKADGNDGVGHLEETFQVHLSQATNAFIGRADGTATIRDEQQLPTGGPTGTDPCSVNDNPDSGLCPSRRCGYDVWHPCEGLKPGIRV